MSNSQLTAKQELFVAEYLKDLNATQAAIRAGYSPATANEQGSQLLAKLSVAAAVRVAIDARKGRLEVSADDVLRILWNLATADSNELVEYRRGACRYCRGENHLYQFTPQEMASRRGAYIARQAAALTDESVEDPGDWCELGGVGFNATVAPHPDCPECFGQGIGYTHVKDTRYLSPAARELYAGVKLTDNGLEVKTHSKDRAVELVGRHLAMFKDKLEVSVDASLTDELRAARERAAGFDLV